LGTDNDIDRGPAKTGNNIEYGNFGELDAGNGNSSQALTNLHPIIPKEETRQHNLPKSKPWAESRKETDRHYGNEIDEEYNQNRIDEPEEKNWVRKGADGKGGDDHVGGEPLHIMLTSTRQSTYAGSAYHGPNLRHAGIRAFIAGHTLNAPRLDTEPMGNSLRPRIEGIADDQGLATDCALVSNVLGAVGLVSEGRIGGLGLDIVVRLFRHLELVAWGGYFFYREISLFRDISVETRQQECTAARDPESPVA
jgi:hypothetical protein